MSVWVRKSVMAAVAVAAVCASGSVFAVKPPAETEGESSDVAAQREAYYALRRMNPYDSNFDSAKARLQAYNQFQQVLLARSTGIVLPGPVHTESWQSIGPAPITLGQTPTNATATSRSPVSGRVSSLAIDPIDNAVYAGGAQGGVWRTRNNGASWTPLTDFLGSLAVGTIVVAPGTHPLNQATLYLGTGEGNFSGDSYGGVGIYKSTDSGHTWQGPYGQAQFGNRSVATIAVDSANANHVLAGSTSGIFGVGGVLGPTLPVRGIYISNDGGATWAISASLSAHARISKIVQDPVVPTIWWAGVSLIAPASGGGLLKSIDNGATWSAVDGVATGLPAIVGANGVSGIARTWLSVSSGGASSVIYLGVSVVTSPGKGGRLYVSTDSGATWTNKPAADGYCQGQCWYDMPVYSPPETTTTVFTGGAGSSGALPSSFMRSTDSGGTFVDKMVGIDGNSALHADFHAITSWPGQPTHIWVGNDGGVFHSDDNGDHWISANTTLQLTQFEGCDLHPTDPSQAYGGTQDNGTDSFLGSTAWTHSDDGDGGFALIDQGTPTNVTHTYFNQSNYLIGAAVALNGPASGPADYLYFSGDYVPGGQNNGINPADNVLFYAPMALDRGVHDTLYFGTDHLYIAPSFFANTVAATNTSIVYTALNGGGGFAPPVPPSTFPGAISAIETIANVVPGSPANTILVGTSNGRVWRSTNAGTSFTETDMTPLVIAQYVSSIVVNPRNPNNVFQSRAGFTGAMPAHNVRVSNDGGATWTDASNGLPDIPVNSLAFDPVFSNQIWAGTDIGMYLSADGGATWIPYNQGVPNVAIFSVKANGHTGNVLTCTHGRGAFLLKLDTIFIDGFDGN
ncbi:hypothetical protein [Dokdonella soli]|uniref:Exo-alpha-sialidase n=1 Tax=Dokdonella soli TaxID=529810 RepID=A0ABN1ITC1_9GAMM